MIIFKNQMEDGEQKTCLQHFSDSIRPTFSFRIEHGESFHLLDFTFSFLAKREEIVTHGCRHPFFSCDTVPLNSSFFTSSRTALILWLLQIYMSEFTNTGSSYALLFFVNISGFDRYLSWLFFVISEVMGPFYCSVLCASKV